ncbi:MAG TPA: DUF1003 domain-containing protein [Ktedonobacterales bacterium]|nr:DUF1003 domain-containing protein [Ktedonobacterales bacterium]
MTLIDQQSTFTGAYALDDQARADSPRSEKSSKGRLAIWLATHITACVGTIHFFVAVLGLTIVWLLWNALGPRAWRFDPAPAYVIWLFTSNVLQLTLLPLLMISQNHQTGYSEQRAAGEYERIGEILAGVQSLRARSTQNALPATFEERIQVIEDRQREMMQILRRLEAGERLRHQKAALDDSLPLPIR